MRGQVGHRESRPGSTQQVCKMKDAEIKDCCHEAAAGLCTAKPFLGLTVTGSRRLGDSLLLSYLPRRSPGAGRLPRTTLGAGASTPGPLPGHRRLP